MIKHKKTSAIPDSGDASLVRSSDWNDDHSINGGLDLPVENVTTPPADTVRIFGRSVGGRYIPAFVGPSGLDSALQPSFARNKIAVFQPAGNSTTTGQIGMAAATAGTATPANVGTSNLHNAMRRIDYLVTTASTSAAAGLRNGAGQYFMGSGILGGFHIVMRFGGATGMSGNNHRFFAGLGSSTVAPTDVAPNSRSNIVGVGYDSGQTNWRLMHRKGLDPVTEIDLGANFPRQVADRAKMYELAMFCAPGGTSIRYEFTELGTTNTVAGEITTNLPDQTTLLNWMISASVGGTSAVIGVSIASIYAETDY